MSKKLEDYLYYQESNPDLKIYCGDCLEILPLMGGVDLVLTDPPYESIGGGNSVPVNEYDLEWDKNRFTREQYEMLLRNSTSQIIWGANYFWDYFEPTNSLIVWDKKCQD